MGKLENIKVEEFVEPDVRGSEKAKVAEPRELCGKVCKEHNQPCVRDLEHKPEMCLHRIVMEFRWCYYKLDSG